MLNVDIRPIVKTDNPKIEAVIRSVFIELGIPLVGTAFQDPETSQMYQAYGKRRSVYYVVEHNNQILGGAGISPLKGGQSTVCELQKMYSLPKMRGQGIAPQLLDKCLQAAKSFGFSQCYLETIPSLKAAIKLYKRNGFYEIDRQLGSTGHHSCSIWMIKDL